MNAHIALHIASLVLLLGLYVILLRRKGGLFGDSHLVNDCGPMCEDPQSQLMIDACNACEAGNELHEDPNYPQPKM